MLHRLRTSLDLVAHALPDTLVTAAALQRMRAVAELLPPVHRAGFECRLARDDDRVDLQQGIVPSSWEPGAVATLAAQFADCAGGDAARAAWQRVRRFCEAWQDPAGRLREQVSELWLELDVPASREAEPATGAVTPSLFATLRTDKVTAGDSAIGLDVARRLLDDADVAAITPVVRACATSVGVDGGHVSHVGIMLGRQPAGVRLHVSGARFRRFATFLHDVGWPGDVDAILASASTLFDHVDEIVLCLDIVCLRGRAHVLPRLGLEAFFTQKRGIDPRWRTLLHSLVERGLADPAKAEALLRWPGAYSPVDAPGPWPDDLVVRALLTAPNRFGSIERRLSHIKLFHDGARPPEAKAYFGYGHLWHDAVTTAEPLDDPPPVTAPAARSTPSLEEAILRAERFLLGARNQAGGWRDFYDLGRSARPGERIAGYASDEWVTAYVAHALASGTSSAAREAAHDAWALLARRRGPDDGWGNSAQLPPDTDSTTWALRLARALGIPRDARIEATERFILSQTCPDGGVMCYRQDDCARIAEYLQMAGPYDGWCAPHTCVTAAVAALGLDPAHRAYLRAAQQPDGRWTGHWWDDDEYATACATEVLAADESPASHDAARRGACWAAGRIGADGAVCSVAHGGPSAYATALALSTIVAVVTRDGASAHPTLWSALARAAAWLRATQRPDGSFAPSARLRVPAPSAIDPLASPETTLTYLDRDATFTTATVYSALVSALAALD